LHPLWAPPTKAELASGQRPRPGKAVAGRRAACLHRGHRPRPAPKPRVSVRAVAYRSA
jgi:hypothetical protein